MIISNDLKKAICYKIGKFNSQELSEEDLAEVWEIDLSGIKLNGEKTDINLKEIASLRNLKRIMLKNFSLNDEAIKGLNSLPQLESVYLAYCEMASNIPLVNSSVNSLVINGCDITDYSLLSFARSTAFIEDDKLKLNRLANKEALESLRLVGCHLRSADGLQDCPALMDIQLEGTKFDDPEVIDSLRSKVEITESENKYPIR